jgi:hypothetical protein
MSKVFLIDLTMQWGMLKKHCDRNIGPLHHAFTLQCGWLATTNAKNMFYTPHGGGGRQPKIYDGLQL